MHGYAITLDQRSYKDQGIDIEPQVKLGKGVKEQEKRAKMREAFEKEVSQEKLDDASGGKSLEGDLAEKEGLDHSQGFIQLQRLIEFRNFVRFSLGISIEF